MAANGLRDEVELQRQRDHDHGNTQILPLAGVKAALTAQQRLAAGADDAGFEFRQACVDLAAVAEPLADDLPPPRV